VQHSLSLYQHIASYCNLQDTEKEKGINHLSIIPFGKLTILNKLDFSVFLFDMDKPTYTQSNELFESPVKLTCAGDVG